MRCIKFFDINVNMILKAWHKTMIMIPLQTGNVDDILVLGHRYHFCMIAVPLSEENNIITCQ